MNNCFSDSSLAIGVETSVVPNILWNVYFRPFGKLVLRCHKESEEHDLSPKGNLM